MNSSNLMHRIADMANLEAAWERVYTNHGSPGIDHITCDDFGNRKRSELLSIQQDLKTCKYIPNTINTVSILKKSGKSRIIGLLTIRDRVCSFAAARVLRSIIEPCLQPCSFAYRPGRSATDAANYVEKLIIRGLSWVLETDIKSYFDTINHYLLLTELSRYIEDDSVIDLVEKFMTASVAGVTDKKVNILGITQGSPLSPLLANLYLNELDKTMLNAGFRYIRYADDLVVLAHEKDILLQALGLLETELTALELSLSEPKTRVATVSEGFIFLGFQFDQAGKGPAMKSIESIREKLMETAYNARMESSADQILRIGEVLRGWQQYFHVSGEIFHEMPVNVLAAAVVIAMDTKTPELISDLTVQLWSLDWKNARMHDHLAQIFVKRKRLELAACQYITVLMCDDLTSEFFENALDYLEINKQTWEKFRLRIAHSWAQIPKEDAWRNLAEIFAEAGAFDLAMMMDLRSRNKTSLRTGSSVSVVDSKMNNISTVESPPDEEKSAENETDCVDLSENSQDLYLKLFRGRDGVLAEEYIDDRGNKAYHKRDLPLNLDLLGDHFAGVTTYGLFISQPNDTVQLCLLDIDVKKRFILTRLEQNRGFEDLVNKAHSYSFDLYDQAKKLGVRPIVEDSGYKGRHLWIFFSDPVAPALARQILMGIVASANNPPEEINVEYFPRRDHAKKDHLGDLIKLPLGINRKSGKFSLFINRDGNYPDQNQALHSIQPVSRVRMKNLMEKGVFKKNTMRRMPQIKKILLSDLENIPSRGPVRRIMKDCVLMRYLVSKSQSINHLTHMERVVLLHVFGHLKDEGQAFIHRVISFCTNYDPNYTQQQMRKLKPSPISCPRLKEMFPQVTVSIKCNCHFGSLAKNAYPSPILWADRDYFGVAEDSGTAFNVSMDQQPVETTGESDTQNEADELVKKYMNIKHNRRGIEKSMRRVEARLIEIMEMMETDSIETSFGVLRCIKTDEDLPRFIIEI